MKGAGWWAHSHSMRSPVILHTFRHSKLESSMAPLCCVACTLAEEWPGGIFLAFAGRPIVEPGQWTTSTYEHCKRVWLITMSYNVKNKSLSFIWVYFKCLLFLFGLSWVILLIVCEIADFFFGLSEFEEICMYSRLFIAFIGSKTDSFVVVRWTIWKHSCWFWVRHISPY